MRPVRAYSLVVLVTCAALLAAPPAAARADEASLPAAGAAAAPGVARPSAERRAAMLDIMVKSSLQVSRTKVLGKAFRADRKLSEKDVSGLADRNFRRAAEFVLESADLLPLDEETARTINRILTEGLVPERIRGNLNYHQSNRAFYRWLRSEEARQLGARDPVALAQKVHREISLADSAPDGNGRTARMMADLVLLKAGLAPARYTYISDYFQRGVPIGWKDPPRPAPSLETQEAYFREIVRAGQAELERRGFRVEPRPIDQERSWPDRGGPVHRLFFGTRTRPRLLGRLRPHPQPAPPHPRAARKAPAVH